MTPDILHGLAAVLLIVANAAAVILTVMQLPGNWCIVAVTALVAWLLPDKTRFDIGWPTVGVVAGLALLGEVIELFAGAAAAKKQGASRRALWLSLLGGIVGAIFGAGGGSVVPVLGTLIGVLVGGAAGAFLGGYLGETWKGRDDVQALAVAKSVAIGRTIGTLAKLSLGVVMFVVTVWDALF